MRMGNGRDAECALDWTLDYFATDFFSFCYRQGSFFFYFLLRHMDSVADLSSTAIHQFSLTQHNNGPNRQIQSKSKTKIQKQSRQKCDDGKGQGSAMAISERIVCTINCVCAGMWKWPILDWKNWRQKKRTRPKKKKKRKYTFISRNRNECEKQKWSKFKSLRDFFVRKRWKSNFVRTLFCTAAVHVGFTRFTLFIIFVFFCLHFANLTQHRIERCVYARNVDMKPREKEKKRKKNGKTGKKQKTPCELIE